MIISFKTNIEYPEDVESIVDFIQSYTAQLQSNWKDLVSLLPGHQRNFKFLRLTRKLYLAPFDTIYLQAEVRIHGDRPNIASLGLGGDVNLEVLPHQTSLQGLSLRLEARSPDQVWHINDFYQTVPEYRIMPRPDDLR
jgi:hypothetical protein